MVVPSRRIAPIDDFYLQKMGKVVRKRVALPGKLIAGNVSWGSRSERATKRTRVRVLLRIAFSLDELPFDCALGQATHYLVLEGEVNDHDRQCAD